ncbi:hypothetical protein GBAR_LOCUS10095 [Geodia barretti]|uniref:Uncharacterized protein n=1 Tax=Geodia barretti TaxID=519541 RepID=A0AA35RRP4_GEOBA|nr:hypothetical protein GBAR_LOCUS10095 [Geodia barretti]
MPVLAQQQSDVDIVVSQNNARYLKKLREEYEVLVSQLYPIGPGWCYIHRDGVEQCENGSLLKFRPYQGRLPPAPGQISLGSILRELYIAEEEADGGKCQAVTVENPPRQSETKEGLHRAIDRAHGEEAALNPKENRRDVGVKIIKDHEVHMREMLKGALEWFCAEKREKGPFVLKLEARFGKVLWRNIPEDVAECALELTNFSHLCFSDTKHSRIFNTNVKREGVEAVKAEVADERISLLETFDIKFTVPGETERVSVDVRLKFDGRKPTVLLVKKNEAKVVVFNVLSLHRDHDIRMTLNVYEIVQPEVSPELYRVVHQLLREVSYDVDRETLTLPPRSRELSVNFIRHKKREAYCIDDKLLLTITSIEEYKDPPSELDLSQSSGYHSDPHIEIEFHNCAWECAFGRDVGLPPEKCLALHMENPAVSPEIARAIPHPWQPEHILEEFQDFWESLDSLNETLGPLH